MGSGRRVEAHGGRVEPDSRPDHAAALGDTGAKETTVLEAGALTLDLRTRRATVGQRTVELSVREFPGRNPFSATSSEGSHASSSFLAL